MTRAHSTTASGDDGSQHGVMLAWLQASCTAQGVPVIVSDPGVVATVATLCGAPSPAGAPPRPRTAWLRSEAPLRADPVDVQRPRPGCPRADDGVIKDGFDDGLLPVQGKGVPLAA
jgi:hypothetical protein